MVSALCRKVNESLHIRHCSTCLINAIYWIHLFYVFQGDIRIHIIYKSAGQEGFNDLINGKMMKYFTCILSSIFAYSQQRKFIWLFWKLFLKVNSNGSICFLDDLPEPPFPSPPFPGSKVVHRRKKRQVWFCCRYICWKLVNISIGMLTDSDWLHFVLFTSICMFVWV